MQLPIIPVLDLTAFSSEDICTIELFKTYHKFSENAELSGVVGEGCCCGDQCQCGDNCDCNEENSFCYGTNSFIEKTKSLLKVNQSSTTYGIPTIIVERNKKYNFRYINHTGQMLNIHYHGMNADSNMDGALSEVMFGENTKIGKIWDRGTQKIYNNSGMIVNHPHPMFESSGFVYGGMGGVVKIVDSYSTLLDKYFKLNDNELVLLSEDYDLYENGVYKILNGFIFKYK